jgi:hypothetical protein
MSNYDGLVQALSDIAVQHNRDNGGLLTLSAWEELNAIEDRDESIYTNEVANALLTELQTYLNPHLSKEDYGLLQVEMAQCGLCINIPPILESLVQGADDILRVYLKGDMDEVLWDDCTPDGKLFW